MSAPFWKSPLKLALTASLLVNLFVVSLVVGRFLRPEPDRQWREMSRNASPELQAAIAEIRDGRRNAFQENREEIKEARERVYAALAAEPFDAEELRAAQGALTDRFRGIHSAINDKSLDLAVRLNAADRKALAEFLRARDEARARRREKRRERENR